MSVPVDKAAHLRIGCFSGFLGDRRDAMDELIESAVDVLVGDYLAELTMLILRKGADRGGPGYAQAFLDEIRPRLGRIADGGLKVVVNAGGLDPAGCAQRLREMCAEDGVSLVVASIAGDDVRDALAHLDVAESPLVNIDTGETLNLGDVDVLTANAYLGAWPIVEALNQGADVVICPRVTDASLVVGPAAWYHQWANDDWDALAGAVIAGHLVECGAQVTGGNFAFFADYPDLGVPGMPVVDVYSDGRCWVSKATGRPGVVNVDTTTAQLLYETGLRLYQNPDVVTDLASVELAGAEGGVMVTGVRGHAPTTTAKLALTFEGGYRNTVMFAVTGLDLDTKLAWIRRQMAELLGPQEAFEEFRMSIIGPSRIGGTRDESTAIVMVAARATDRRLVARAAFSNRFAELITSSIPGMYLIQPPADARAYAVQWPCLIPKSAVNAEVTVGPHTTPVAWGPMTDVPPVVADIPRTPPVRGVADTSPVAIGSLFGARSGDKAGAANVGVWARTDDAYVWLRATLDDARLLDLLPELRNHRIVRTELPNVRALNFVIYGLLNEGVASNLDMDGQAKALGEYLRSKVIDVPDDLLRDAGAESVGALAPSGESS